MGCCPDTDSDLNLLSVMLVTKTIRDLSGISRGGGGVGILNLGLEIR